MNNILSYWWNGQLGSELREIIPNYPKHTLYLRM